MMLGFHAFRNPRGAAVSVVQFSKVDFWIWGFVFAMKLFLSNRWFGDFYVTSCGYICSVHPSLIGFQALYSY